ARPCRQHGSERFVPARRHIPSANCGSQSDLGTRWARTLLQRTAAVIPMPAAAADLAGLGRLRGGAVVDPAGLGPGLHDDRPALVARKPETVEHPGMACCGAARLLGPAVQIIGRAS